VSIFDYFKSTKKSTASIAKERLQVIVAHERSKRNQPDYLPALQREILEVIRKYVNIEQDQIEVQLETNGDCSILELNVTLPD
jgi:cell division topological specificity factor